MQNTHKTGIPRRGFTVRDLAVTLTLLLVAGGLLVSLTGATRSLSQAQVCANNLRQLFTGMAAYVNQYNAYPPNGPYPQYMSVQKVNGLDTAGWDPNIGFIMTHGLGLTPPATDTTTGHFIWYGVPYDTLPDVCKCPALPPALMDPANPELSDPAIGEGTPLESVVYQYALSYQTSGTCRAACPITYPRRSQTQSGEGGRNPLIPNPTSNTASGQPWDNAQRGIPGVYVFQHALGAAANDPSNSGQEPLCWIQAVHPAEVQSPGRTYYLADSRDYRPEPKTTIYHYPPAGLYNGWLEAYSNQVLLGTRHFEYANVMYLDGSVTRDNQTHNYMWNMGYVYPGPALGTSPHWRCSTFASDVRLANIRTAVHIMPVLMVKGWEYFFDASGVKAQ